MKSKDGYFMGPCGNLGKMTGQTDEKLDENDEVDPTIKNTKIKQYDLFMPIIHVRDQEGTLTQYSLALIRCGNTYFCLLLEPNPSLPLKFYQDVFDTAE